MSLSRLREFQQTFGAKSTIGKKIDVECDACEVAIDLTRAFVDKSNATRRDVGPVIDFFCVALKIEDPHVCSEIVVEFESLFLYLLSILKIACLIYFTF